MPAVIYGDGTLYGDADAFYGRITADLSQAQQAFQRETGLQVQIVDERLNNWALLAGSPQKPYYSLPGTGKAWTQRYYSYRGTADMCILDNGTIIRVRNDIFDQQIYIQTITDPTVAAQWESWSLLYSGVHYAVAIAPVGNSYNVYTIKSDGLYRNNVLQWAQTDLMLIQCARGTDGRQDADRLWIMRVQNSGLIIPPSTSYRRKFDAYYTSDITSVTPTQVSWNYAWYRHNVASHDRADGKVIRVTSFPMYAPEALNTGETLAVEITPAGSESWQYGGARLIRGLPSEVGHNHVSAADIIKLSDGYYYLVYVEAHVSDEWEAASNVYTPIVWQRSKDGVVWSEPVYVGFTTWGFAGMVEKDGWAYLAGNGEVYRRQVGTVTYDISNYVPGVEWESPRENQTGSGQLTVANPEDVHAGLRPLADRRIYIKPGIKTAAGYEFVPLDDFWVKRITRQIDGKVNRLNIEFGNIWARLENQLRDVMNFIGKTEYQDWGAGRPNEAFAYYFESGEGSTDANGKLVITEGTVLWTGWRGLNPFFHISFNVTPFTVYFRYKDENNHYRATYNGSTVVIDVVVNGTATQLVSNAVGTGKTRLGIRTTWKLIDVYVNGAYSFTYEEPTPAHIAPGYVGWNGGAATVWDFVFEDLEYNFTSEDLVRQALALGEYFDVKVGGAGGKQFALMWGPQTDLPTAAEGLRNVLEAEKWELIWRDGFIEVGKFTEVGPVKTIENRIIRTEEVHSGNQRINFASIDGNEDTWIEIDTLDALERGRMINAYFDLPELLTEDQVRDRAREEIRRGKLSEAPAGSVPLFFDLWRMDPVNWVDNAGNSKLVRIEGIRVSINQSTEPSQRCELDTSLIEDA